MYYISLNKTYCQIASFVTLLSVCSPNPLYAKSYMLLCAAGTAAAWSRCLRQFVIIASILRTIDFFFKVTLW